MLVEQPEFLLAMIVIDSQSASQNFHPAAINAADLCTHTLTP
jgi:hypothetical protein